MSVLWLTGFSGAGKSTIAEKLSTLIESCQIVDGDVIRRTISSDLKQGDTDRNEHFRRVINYIKSNITKSEFTIAAFVSANKTQREWIRTKGSIIYLFYGRYHLVGALMEHFFEGIAWPNGKNENTQIF